MLTKRERTSGTWAGLGILAVGIAIGALARPARWFPREARPAPGSTALAPELVPAGARPTPRSNDLRTLELVIPESSAEVLQRARDAALERGILVADDKDVVPAEVVVDGARQPAELRLKGDWTDHVEGSRWSYRIRLRAGTFLGMREFSIQAPRTRGYLWEWLVHTAARREGVLAPRSTFVNVVQNGHDQGAYFLEEHFEKELLEAQGRREGPIVIWDESTLWAALLREGSVPAKGVRALESALLEPAHTLAPAEIRAYGEKRLSSIEGLDRVLAAALDEMKALRALALAAEADTDRRRALEAVEELRGRTLEELVDVERLGRAHALASVFQLEHPLAWHNQRFYRDPVAARLEPILFDTAAADSSARDPVPFRARDLTAAFAASPGYYDALFVHLGRMLRAGWLDELFAAVEPELARFEAALLADGPLPAGCSVGEMKQRLRAQVVWLRKACLPGDPTGFSASYELTDAGRNAGKGWLEVEAWATTRSPVLIEGFRFSNGSFSPAAGALAPGSAGARVRGPGVVLPPDGRTVLFRFPMDERLANLETVEKVTRAIRQELRAAGPLDLDVRVVQRLLAGEEAQEEPLYFRRKVHLGEGRPAAPTLAEALERHPFLRLDPARGELLALAGTWDVAGDLVLPAGVGLALGPGTTLHFAPDAVLVADAPLSFAGSAREPVVLEPAPGAASWQGIVVLDAPGRSEWHDVVVRGTAAVARGGWVLTGGITFYRSPVTLERCRFEGTLAEDGLNVFGTDLAFDDVVFTGCASDSFDGDFVTGTIERCVFQDGGADGLDVSGSDVTVRDCRFLRLGDKALSIGERSRARIEGGEAVDVALGVASKDDSDVEVSGLAIEARNYALAAFVKKPEYGPTRLLARELTIRGAGLGVAIAQTGCRLEVDGVPVATQDVDVEASYQEGVLGRPK
jgi:hypothetical protein